MPRLTGHQERIRDFAYVPRQPRPHHFVWSAAQKRAGDRIFLRRKWVYDAGQVTAYGVNMRLWARSQNKRVRTPKGGFNG